MNQFIGRINVTQQLCRTFNISMKFMIEQLDANQNYFRLKTNQDRLIYLEQLNIKRNNQTQCIFSSFKSQKQLTDTEED